jgi:hypothetical protein
MKIFLNKNLLLKILPTSFLIIIFISDVITFLTFNSEFAFSKYPKALLTLIIILFLFIKKRMEIKLIVVSFFLFCVGIYNFNSIQVLESIQQYFKYFSGILFLLLLVNINYNLRFKKIFESILIFFSLNILLAFFLELSFFKTYYSIARFGYMPLFNSQNEFSFIMITSISYFYKNSDVENSFKNKILLLIVLIASLLVGTKVIYLFICCFLIYIIFKYLGIIKGSGLILILVFINIAIKNLWISLIKNHFEVFVNLYKNTGLLNTVSSNRIENLKIIINTQTNEFNFINYLFGGGDSKYFTEMSLFDIFLFFGCIGGMLYLFIYLKVIYRYLALDTFGLFYLISLSILSFLGGFYFESYTAQIYSVTFLYLTYALPFVYDGSKKSIGIINE